MKKNIFFIIIIIVLNGCAQYSSIVGPAYTMAKTGNLMLTGTSALTSYGIKKKTGYRFGLVGFLTVDLQPEQDFFFANKYQKIF